MAEHGQLVKCKVTEPLGEVASAYKGLRISVAPGPKRGFFYSPGRRATILGAWLNNHVSVFVYSLSPMHCSHLRFCTTNLLREPHKSQCTAEIKEDHPNKNKQRLSIQSLLQQGNQVTSLVFDKEAESVSEMRKLYSEKQGKALGMCDWRFEERQWAN